MDIINQELVISAYNGFVDRVYSLVKRGANDFDSALIAASKRGHLHIVNFMIEKGAKKIDKALSKAVKYNNYDIVKYLIYKGANINVAFIYASRYGRSDILLLCLSRVSIHTLDVDYALSQAIKYRHRNIVGILKSL